MEKDRNNINNPIRSVLRKVDKGTFLIEHEGTVSEEVKQEAERSIKRARSTIRDIFARQKSLASINPSPSSAPDLLP